MKAVRIGLVFLLAAIAASPGLAADPVVHAGPSEAVKAWQAAMEAGDLEALARMHDAATIGFPPGQMKIVGVDAIMKDYRGLFARYDVKVAFDETHWVEQPPLLVSWGLYTLTLHPKAGGPDKVTHGRFTDAAVKVDGHWRYLVDHASIPTAR